MNIGASFIDGFVQGFRGEEVASAIWEGMSNFFSSHPLASLILGGAGLSRLSGGLTPVLAQLWALEGIYKALKSDTAGKIGTSVIGSLIGTSAQTGGRSRVVTGGLMKGASCLLERHQVLGWQLLQVESWQVRPSSVAQQIYIKDITQITNTIRSIAISKGA